MKNSDYWKERFKQLEAAANKNGAEYYHEIEEQFTIAQRQIEKEVLLWYQRFATNNEVTMAEARQMLNAKQLAELKWNVKEYIKYGEENALDGRWMKELENASSRFHITRLEALKLQTQQVAEVLYGNQTDGLDAMMKRVYLDGYYHTAFEVQKGFNVGWDIAGVDQSRLEKIISKPWAADGKNFSDRIWGNKKRLINEVHTQLTQTCILGKAPDDAIKNIAKKMGVSKSNAGRLVMTESAYFASASQKDCFNELDVEKFEILATLDSHTSAICQELDGKVFDMKEYDPGVTAPPFHVWCRSTTIPYFDDDDFELGERAARGEDGKTYYVPSDVKYPEWKKNFVDGGNKDGLKVAGDSGIINVEWKGLNYTSSYSKAEAISRLQTEYGITFKDSRKYPMDGGLMNDCVGWLDSFSNQYKEFMNKNPCKIPCIENKAPTKIKGAIGMYTYYTNAPSVVDIGLNGQYHSNIKMFQEYVNKCVDTKWYPANATIHKTFVHEYGHHVSNSMKWISNEPKWEHNFLSECIKDFKNIEPEYNFDTFVGMKDYVSEYGSKSEAELFAEAFAEYFGGNGPREFAKIFGAKLDALLKGVG